MSENRSSVVNLSRRSALAPRTRRRSRPHGAHRGGPGQVNSAGRDVADLAEAARSWYPSLRRAMAGPVLAMHVFGQIYSIHFARGPPCQKSEVESQIEYQEVQGGQASSAAQAAEGCCQHSSAGGCCNGSSRLRR